MKTTENAHQALETAKGELDRASKIQRYKHKWLLAISLCGLLLFTDLMVAAALYLFSSGTSGIFHGEGWISSFLFDLTLAIGFGVTAFAFYAAVVRTKQRNAALRGEEIPDDPKALAFFYSLPVQRAGATCSLLIGLAMVIAAAIGWVDASDLSYQLSMGAFLLSSGAFGLSGKNRNHGKP